MYGQTNVLRELTGNAVENLLLGMGPPQIQDTHIRDAEYRFYPIAPPGVEILYSS